MTETQFENHLARANTPLTDPTLNFKVGNGPPEFELYHFALSVCSQKVRACLAEKSASYTAHDINIDPGNYHPDYIRLRLLGRDGRKMARGYTGRSSAATEGFDPMVVPTLADLKERKVVVDSVTICNHIDARLNSGTDLNPTGLKAAIDAEIAIVDETPHVAVLYGAHPDVDFRPERLRGVMIGLHDRRIARLEKFRDAVSDDAELVAAHNAKIEKERNGRSFVATPEAMRAAVQEMVKIVADLDARLSDGRTWICGENYTMADIMWAVSLFRMKWIGMAFNWEGNHPLNSSPHPNAEAYGRRLFDRQSFRDAVIHWPGVPRSEFVSEYYDD